MPTMSMYSMTEADMTENANLVKEHLLEALERDGILKEGAAKEISGKYVVVQTKPSCLGRIWMALKGVKEEDRGSLYIQIMKTV